MARLIITSNNHCCHNQNGERRMPIWLIPSWQWQSRALLTTSTTTRRSEDFPLRSISAGRVIVTCLCLYVGLNNQRQQQQSRHDSLTLLIFRYNTIGRFLVRMALTGPEFFFFLVGTYFSRRVKSTQQQQQQKGNLNPPHVVAFACLVRSVSDQTDIVHAIRHFFSSASRHYGPLTMAFFISSFSLPFFFLVFYSRFLTSTFQKPLIIVSFFFFFYYIPDYCGVSL